MYVSQHARGLEFWLLCEGCSLPCSTPKTQNATCPECGVTPYLVDFVDNRSMCTCRMQFFHEGGAPPAPEALQSLSLPPPPPRPVGESPEIAEATAAIVAVENEIVTDIPGDGSSPTPPSFDGACTLQQQGGTDGSMTMSMSSPPPPPLAVVEKRTLVVYPPECLLHM